MKKGLEVKKIVFTLHLNICSDVIRSGMSKNKIDVCSVEAVDLIKVQRVQRKLPPAEEIQAMAEMFRALGDPTRLRIILALTTEEMCVCDLTALTEVSASAISHQLRVLRGLKLVKYRKQGKMVYYSLDDEHIKQLIAAVQEHVNE
jgi:ArsR family transcriptional regulator